jgi:hypothetical protein
MIYYDIHSHLNIIKDKQENEDKRPFVHLPLPCPPLKTKKQKTEEKDGENDKENGVIIVDI